VIQIKGYHRDDPPGYYRGRHLDDYRAEVRELKRSGRLDEACRLLFALVEAAERESKAERQAVATWPYAELASVYRKQKDHLGEASLLGRFAAWPRREETKAAARLLARRASVSDEADESSKETRPTDS
jgi:hypothetical protein